MLDINHIVLSGTSDKIEMIGTSDKIGMIGITCMHVTLMKNQLIKAKRALLLAEEPLSSSSKP